MLGIAHRSKHTIAVLVATALAASTLAPRGATAQGIGPVTYGTEGVANEILGSGHSNVMLDNLCADGPYKVRVCNPGEERGVVVGRYLGFGNGPDGTSINKDFMVVPRHVAFFGTETPQSVPVVVTGTIARTVKEDYRRRNWESVLPSIPSATNPDVLETPGEWAPMVGASFRRDAWVVHLQTNPDDDQKAMACVNDLANDRNRFMLVGRSCADFAAEVVNCVYPGASNRTLLKDFFVLRSPKQVIKSAIDYGKDHPDVMMYVEYIPQIPGSMKFAGTPKFATENAYKQKKFLLPLLLKPHLLAYFVGVSQIGNINLDDAVDKFATLDLAQLRKARAGMERAKNEKKQLSAAGCDSPDELTRLGQEIDEIEAAIDETDNAIALQISEAEAAENAAFTGFRAKFTDVVAKALATGVITADQARMLREGAPQTYNKQWEGAGTSVRVDPELGLLLTKNGATTGLTPANIEAATSDKRLALQVMLGAVNHMLKASDDNRPYVATLEQNWAIMSRLADTNGVR